MKVDALRKIDRFFGIPICFLLTVFDQVLRFVKPVGLRHPRNILVIQLSEMGSLALAYPSVRRLRQKWPDAEVYFLVFRRNRNFLELLDLIPKANIWTIDDSSMGAFLRTTLEFLRKAQALPVDAVLDYEIFSRASMILSYLSGAQRRAGFSNYRAEGLYRGDLLTHPIYYNGYHHISLNFLAMAEALTHDRLEQPAVKKVFGGREVGRGNKDQEEIESGRPSPTGDPERQPLAGSISQPDLSLPKRSIPAERQAAMLEKVRALYPDLSPSSRIITLSPFSGNLLPIRAWPTANYIPFIQGLLAEMTDTIILLIGLPEARAYCRPILQAISSPRLIDFIGHTKDIAEVIDLISISSLFATSDSGPPHFASLTNTPTIVLFGPETPLLYGPLGDNVQSVYLGMYCSPCVSAFNHRDTPCRRNRCMEEISPESILHLSLQKLGA